MNLKMKNRWMIYYKIDYIKQIKWFFNDAKKYSFFHITEWNDWEAYNFIYKKNGSKFNSFCFFLTAYRYQ